jgi:hypothetical protein
MTDDMRAFEKTLSDLENSHKDAAAPPSRAPETIAPYLPLPVGVPSMLEAQLGEGLKMMREFVDCVHHPAFSMDAGMRLGDTFSRIMLANAALAEVAARLQKGDSETRHRMIVEHVAPPAGEGMPKSRKRIKRGDD